MDKMAKEKSHKFKKNKSLPASAPLKGADFNSTNKNQKPVTTSNAQDKKGKKGRFSNFFKKINKSFRETFLELKKVTWAPLPKALKQTLVVLVVILFFVVIIGAIDALLAFLFKLLTTGKV